MVTPSNVAGTLVERFDRTQSMLFEDAVLWALQAMGLSEYEALEWIGERQTYAVLRHLEAHPAATIPFDISVNGPQRLIGKARVRSTDSSTMATLRSRLEIIEPLSSMLTEMDDTQFEHLCAAIVLRAGALEAGVTQPGDDGGIDFFGRIPVLWGDPQIPESLVRTGLDVRPLLILGQAKRYAASSPVDRAELQKFAGQARDCLAKYKGMKKAPSHCVPFSYYEEGEASLTFFFTTSTFTAGASDYAGSVNMLLADGRLIAELLVYWNLPIKSSGDIGAQAVSNWMEEVSRAQPLIHDGGPSSLSGE